jgi:hypothetical protein
VEDREGVGDIKEEGFVFWVGEGRRAFWRTGLDYFCMLSWVFGFMFMCHEREMAKNMYNGISAMTMSIDSHKQDAVTLHYRRKRIVFS